ncbi:MAG: MipA/OmpV family protein [Rhodocyclaceae bacterium]
MSFLLAACRLLPCLLAASGCSTLLHAEVKPVDDKPVYRSEAGVGFVRTQSVMHGGQMSSSVMPYLIHEEGPFFARIDTFGIKTVKTGYGHVELLGRYRGDGYSVAGLTRRDNPVLLGLGTLQITPFGAVEATLLRDAGDSAGSIAQTRYITRGTLWRLTFYPELGVEFLDSRYTRHYYGTRQQDATTVGQTYLPSSATNLFAGLLGSVRITERIAFNAYIRRTWYDDAIEDSPLVRRGSRNSFFLALARAF